MIVLIVYSSKGNSTRFVAEEISKSHDDNCEIYCLNNQRIRSENLRFDHLILVCPTYGDEELEIEMEKFLIESDWSNHNNKSFSVCELGLYRGYADTSQGAGKIISRYLKEKNLCRKGVIYSVDSIPLGDLSLVKKWSKSLL
jgi:flavodoxin